MGYFNWDPEKWDDYAAAIETKTTAEVFQNTATVNTLSPLNITIRESRDSKANPESTPIIVGGDVTGSLGDIAKYFVSTGLGVFFETLLKRKPISDPHMAFYAIGDALHDKSPLQVTQFEADLKIAKWLEQVHVEQGGGGNGVESYELAYYFAAFKTAHDAFVKRKKRGYMFTYGDEGPNDVINKDQVKKIIGDELEANLSFKEVLSVARKYYYCYHILIEQGSYIQQYGIDSVKKRWIPLFGENVIVLPDYRLLSETMISIIEVNEGKLAPSNAGSIWSGDTALVVSKAVRGLTKTAQASANTGLTRL